MAVHVSFVLISFHEKVHTTPFRVCKNILPLQLFLGVTVSKSFVFFSFVDSTTRRLNKVLIDSGFAPEWISLDKEIRHDIKRLRDGLLTKRAELGPNPLTLEASITWEQNLKEFEEKLPTINQKIDKFNMIVPILNKQRVHVNFQKEVDRTVENCGYGSVTDSDFQTNSCERENKNERNRVNLTFIQRLLEKCRVRFLKRFSESGNTS